MRNSIFQLILDQNESFWHQSLPPYSVLLYETKHNLEIVVNKPQLCMNIT